MRDSDVAQPFIAPFRPREAGFEIDIDQQREIRLQAPARDAIEFQHHVRYRARARSPGRPASNP